jgi:hypothetical protein
MSEILASDFDRDRVVYLLKEAFAQGRLTEEDLSRRMTAALAARSRGDLEQLLVDLPPLEAPETSERRWVVAIAGTTARRGRWRPARRLKALALLGSCVVDLSQATTASEALEVRAIAILGSIEVVVPSGAAVDLSGAAFLGSLEHLPDERPPGPLTGLAPRLEIKVRGMPWLGHIEVRSAPPAQATGLGELRA